VLLAGDGVVADLLWSMFVFGPTGFATGKHAEDGIGNLLCPLSCTAQRSNFIDISKAVQHTYRPLKDSNKDMIP
jgi:hypothetical protein